jgi:hypothetical protein
MTDRAKHWRRGAVGLTGVFCWALTASWSAFVPTVSASPSLAPAGPLGVYQPGTVGRTKPLSAGGSATAFRLQAPVGAACSGDSAHGGFRVQSYIVPASVDPSSLTFDTLGPTSPATGARLRQPLYAAGSGSPWVSENTAVKTGLLPEPPVFDFAWVTRGSIPAGRYNLGFACTKAAGTVVDRYWNVQFDIASSTKDRPGGVVWHVVANTAVSDTLPVANDPAPTEPSPVATDVATSTATAVTDSVASASGPSASLSGSSGPAQHSPSPAGAPVLVWVVAAAALALVVSALGWLRRRNRSVS